MKTVYSEHTISIFTENGELQLVFQVPKEKREQFMSALQTGNMQVEFFAVENLRVFIRNSKGVVILSERVPLRQKGW
jgi:hypothetical protein